MDFGTEYMEWETKKSSPLTQVDYNLNSPLMIRDDDYMRDFLLCGQGVPSDFHSKRRLWELMKADIPLKERDDLIPYQDYHSTMIKILNEKWFRYSRKNVLVMWEDIYDIAQEPVKVTSEALNLEHKDKSLKGRFKKLSDPDDWRYCKISEYMFGSILFFLMTLIMNCSKFDTVLSNVKRYFMKISKDPGLDIVSIKNKEGKTVIKIYPGAVYFRKWKMVVSRNFFLMIKDILTARGNGLTSLIDRQDLGDELYNIQTVLSMYEHGDEILSQTGCRGYKGIKLLEPMCNDRMAALADRMKKLLPRFDALNKHIGRTLSELERPLGNLTGKLWSLVKDQTNPKLTANMFGSFRHWGHPYIKSLEGISHLYDRVTSKREINSEYVYKSASDFARKILRSVFLKQRRWSVDVEKMDESDPLYNFIKNNTWPTKKVILDYGDRWHRLPITQAFELPEAIDMSDLYSDKSHSMDRSEFLEVLRNLSGEFFRSKKVMKTLLEAPDLCLKEKFEQWSRMGVPDESKIIGLKEIELKEKGRFFSLMSWELRLYFVVTEYLIKENFLPLFDGLTMGDSQSSVIQQMAKKHQGSWER